MARALIPSLESSPKPSPRADKIRKLMLKGYTAGEIAERLARGDAKKKRVIRTQILRIMARDQQWLEHQSLMASAEMVDALPGAAAAVGRRAKRGRTDAAKLMFEATGFHNPKVQHEHSGDISVTLKTVPRPKAVENDDIVDAEVVED